MFDKDQVGVETWTHHATNGIHLEWLAGRQTDGGRAGKVDRDPARHGRPGQEDQPWVPRADPGPLQLVFTRPIPSPPLAVVFQVYDRDSDGLVSENDMLSVLSEVAQGSVAEQELRTVRGGSGVPR